MTETINGLHSCKPGNDPIVGQIKLFVIQHMTSKKGKPYIKIKSANEENGGTPYRILAAEKTDFVDQYQNVSYNLEVEPSSSPPSTVQNLRATMQQGDQDQGDAIITSKNAPQSPPHAQQGDTGPMSKDDYWRRKEDRDVAKEGREDQRQKFIIRQHSQSMSLEVLKLKVTLNELTVEDLTPAKLKALANYFDSDVFGATNGN